MDTDMDNWMDLKKCQIYKAFLQSLAVGEGLSSNPLHVDCSSKPYTRELAVLQITSKGWSTRFPSNGNNLSVLSSDIRD